MQSKYGLLWRFAAAFLASFTLASMAHSQFVLTRLTELQVQIPSADWLRMTAEDWLGLLPTYGSLVATGLLIAFTLTGFLRKHYRSLPGWLYGIAGLMALLTIQLSLQPIMDITLLAGARSALGIACQGLAGFVGGLVFYLLRPRIRQHFSTSARY